MKKHIYFIVTIVIISLWCLRVSAINSKAEKANISIYNKGETVSIGNNFFENNSIEKMDGYTIKVLESKLITADEYIKEKNLKKENLIFADINYFYLVTVAVKNETNDFVGQYGLDFNMCFLQGKNYLLRIDNSAYDAENPDMNGSLSFSLKKGDEKKFVLPFFVLPDSSPSYERIKSDTPKFVVSLYPNKKMLNIE